MVGWACIRRPVVAPLDESLWLRRLDARTVGQDLAYLIYEVVREA